MVKTKVLIIAIVSVLLCAFILPTLFVWADPVDVKPVRPCREQCRVELCEQIKEIKGVADVRVCLIGCYAFVAVKTKGITSATANTKLIDEVKQTAEQCEGITKVYVSTSVKAFSAVDDASNRRELMKLLELFGIDKADFSPRCDRSKLPHRGEKLPPSNLPYGGDNLPVPPEKLTTL